MSILRDFLVRRLPGFDVLAAALVPHAAVVREYEVPICGRRNETAHALRVLLTICETVERHPRHRTRERHARRALHVALPRSLNAEKQRKESHCRYPTALRRFWRFFDCAGTPFGVMLLRGFGFVFSPALTAARKRRCASSSLYDSLSR